MLFLKQFNVVLFSKDGNAADSSADYNKDYIFNFWRSSEVNYYLLILA
jgi:hypothetical protein